jgi:hypothetical protein
MLSGLRRFSDSLRLIIQERKDGDTRLSFRRKFKMNSGEKSMHSRQVLLSAILLTTFCTCYAATADDATATMDREEVIALKTDNFELEDTVVSDLAVGESKTIFTDDDRTIDLLRTDEGLEIYVDGVLQDMDIHFFGEADEAGAGSHEIEIVCTGDENCDQLVWVEADEDFDSTASADADEVHVIKREIRIECSDESDCDEPHVWIEEDGASLDSDTADGDVHVIRLHEDTDGAHEGESNKVIVIRKKAGQD